MPRLSVVYGGVSHLCFHACRVLVDAQNGDTSLLWLQGWEISLRCQWGIQPLIYTLSRRTNKALFPPSTSRHPRDKIILAKPPLWYAPLALLYRPLYACWHWGIPRSSHQPNQLPHHTRRMQSTSPFPSLKRTLLHAELMQECKILGSHWNIQGICFHQRSHGNLYSKSSPRWERTQWLC